MYSILEQSCENSKKRHRRETTSVCEKGSRREHHKGNKFFADKNGTSVLKPSGLIDGRTVTEILQKKAPESLTIIWGDIQHIRTSSSGKTEYNE